MFPPSPFSPFARTITIKKFSTADVPSRRLESNKPLCPEIYAFLAVTRRLRSLACQPCWRTDTIGNRTPDRMDCKTQLAHLRYPSTIILGQGNHWYTYLRRERHFNWCPYFALWEGVGSFTSSYIRKTISILLVTIGMALQGRSLITFVSAPPI
jgi:hypothetical protein